MYNSGFIPIKAMSINSAWKGRRFKTKAYEKWQESILWSLPHEEEMLKSRTLGMSFIFYLKSPTRMDLDNLLKGLIDCVKKKGIIEDDRYVFYLEATKRKTEKEEGFEIEIIEI